MSCPAISWNAPHLKASNWLLINLQRHSDHHYKPDRRFPLLQTYAEDEAPQLPYGYPDDHGRAAMVPPLWRRIMNPRVRLAPPVLSRHHRLALRRKMPRHEDMAGRVAPQADQGAGVR
jgi:hypothetical protein